MLHQGGVSGNGSYITEFTTPCAAVPSSMCSASLTTTMSTIPYPYHSLTAILISRFLINLREANLRSVKVESDDPAYISSHSENSLPSFVAAPGTTRPPLEASVEQYIEAGVLDNGETGEVNDVEDEILRVEVPPVEVEL